MDDVDAVTTVDSRGKRCPAPVLDLAKAIGALGAGEDVLLLADDPGARIDVPVWCRLKRHELVAAEELAGGGFRFRVRRG